MESLITLSALALLSTCLVGCWRSAVRPTSRKASSVVGIEPSRPLAYPRLPMGVTAAPGSANGVYQIDEQTTLEVGMGDDVVYGHSIDSSK
jgi:hypothetical protein